MKKNNIEVYSLEKARKLKKKNKKDKKVKKET